MTDIDEAALEIWRRKDVADVTQIAAFRAAAGLPSQEEMLKAYPSSDEDEHVPEAKEVEEISKRPAKKKVKKVNIGTESLGKNHKVAKNATTKDGPKSKSTPSKSDGLGSKPKVLVRPVTSEKNDTSTTKSKKGLSASKKISNLACIVFGFQILRCILSGLACFLIGHSNV